MTSPSLPTLAILDATFAGVPDAMLVVDVEGTIVLANPAAVTLFGYPLGELVGLDVDTLVPDGQRTQHTRDRDAFRRSAASGAMSAGRQLRARRKDGRLVPVDISLSTVPLAEGTFVLAIARDVAVYQRFLEACPIALFVAENERITYANPAAFELVGADHEAGLGSTRLLDHLHPDDRAPMAAWLATAGAAAETIRAPIAERVVRADGAIRSVETSSVVVPNVAESTVMVAMRDVTERVDSAERTRAIETALRQQQRLADIGAVTTKVVLDIANPVAGLIMGSQRVLQMLDRLPDEQARPIVPGVERVLATARHLDVLLQEFREFVRLQKLDLTTVPLATLLAELVDAWKRDATALRVKLRVEGADGVTLRADALKLRQALDDLVKNALEAIEKGPGEIRITVLEGSAGKARIVVRDTGPGIRPGIDPFAIFETTKPNGTGLGLPSVRQIVEAHGGTVRLVSDEGARGAAFEIELPEAPRVTPRR